MELCWSHGEVDGGGRFSFFFSRCTVLYTSAYMKYPEGMSTEVLYPRVSRYLLSFCWCWQAPRVLAVPSLWGLHVVVLGGFFVSIDQEIKLTHSLSTISYHDRFAVPRRH